MLFTGACNGLDEYTLFVTPRYLRPTSPLPVKGAGIGVGGPIIAVEKRESSFRQAKHGARAVGLSKTVLLDSERTTPFSAKKGKHGTRVSVRTAPVIAVEESRRKAKWGRG